MSTIIKTMESRVTSRIEWIKEYVLSIMDDYSFMDRYQAVENFIAGEAYRLALDHMGLKWPVEVACLSDTQRKKFILLQKRYEELIFRGV